MRYFVHGPVALVLLAACVRFDSGSSVVGDVRRTDAQPIVGVKVYLDVPARAGTDRYFLVDSALTDSRGCYHLFSLHPPGSIRVSFSKDGYRPLRLVGRGGRVAARAVLAAADGTDSSRGVWRQLTVADSANLCYRRGAT